MATYQIELANNIRHGRCVGNEYVVTRRPDGFSRIIARFSTRDEAVEFIADAHFQDTIRQMLADWTDATPEQRAEALRLAAISAERAR